MMAITVSRARRAVAALVLVGALTVPAACGTSDSGDSPAQATVALPAGFPADQVPLVDGAVVNATDGKADGRTVYTITVQATDGADKGFEQAKQMLLGGGYSVVSEGTPNGGHNAQLAGNGMFVTISTVAGAAIPNAVQYQVTQ